MVLLWGRSNSVHVHFGTPQILECNFGTPQVRFRGSVMEVHHPVFYASLGHMQHNMRSSVTLKLKLALILTLTDTGGAVLTLMLGYRPGGELP